jgi:hypothetical protein
MIRHSLFSDELFGDSDDKAILLFFKFQRYQVSAKTRARDTESGIELVQRAVHVALNESFVVVEKVAAAQIEGHGEMLTRVLVSVVAIAFSDDEPEEDFLTEFGLKRTGR